MLVVVTYEMMLAELRQWIAEIKTTDARKYLRLTSMDDLESENHWDRRAAMARTRDELMKFRFKVTRRNTFVDLTLKQMKKLKGFISSLQMYRDNMVGDYRAEMERERTDLQVSDVRQVFHQTFQAGSETVSTESDDINFDDE